MWRARLTALLLLAGILLPAAPRIFAQHEPTADDVAEGERLFTSTCTGCHGAEGDAVFGVDLGRGQFRNSTTDDDLVRTIRNGLTGTAMPPSTFTDEQARNLVAYLRSRVSTPLSMVPGDAGRGKALFEGKGKCVTCHRVEGNGSRFGPDLSDIGQLRKVPELERSLVEPGAEIVPANRMLRVVTRDGAVTTGRLLNHDTFAVLLIDAQERLRSFAKASLQGVPVRGYLAHAFLSGHAQRRRTHGRGSIPRRAQRDAGQMTTRTTRTSACCSAPAARDRRPEGAGHLRPSPARRQGAAELADLLRQRSEPALQPARRRSRRRTSRTWSCSGCSRRGRSRNSRRRRWSSTASCTRCRRPTTSSRSTPRPGAIFWMYSYRPSPHAAALLRPREPRRRDSRRHAVHGHHRRRIWSRVDAKSGKPIWDVARRPSRKPATR